MTRTLVLNVGYEPLGVVSFKRALVLVLADKAHVVETGSQLVRSAEQALPVPSVIRLARHVRVPYRSRPPLSRRNILLRDGYTCQFTHCGARATTIDHLLPRSRGGGDSWDNLVAACGTCNTRKGNRTLQEMGWALCRQPDAPRTARRLIIGAASGDPAWEPYLGGPPEFRAAVPA